MGIAIDRDRFEPHDHARFAGRLRENLKALEELLRRPGFGVGRPTLGAELEMFLVDEAGIPVPYNQKVLDGANDDRVTVELARFNLEVNARPVGLSGRSFSTLEHELSGLLAKVRASAQSHGARVAVIGILPTLTPLQLGPDAMTKRARYRALSTGILGSRERPLRVRIDGDDPLDLEWDEVTLQGANTSFQMHLRVDPKDFARVYNAAQIATAPALAISGNSHFFLGHRLWEETRIALFKQATDDRSDLRSPDRAASRASFGHGWLREGALELFHEGVALHAPMIPLCGEDEDSLAVVRAGGVPQLSELRLHNGTIWTWNRAVYDPGDGGHLRIEFRPLPAGPTMKDMLASSAFLIGLTLALAEEMEWMLPALPFDFAERNFYRSAREGLDAELLWPSMAPPSPRPMRAADLARELLPWAERGLRSAGVDASEVSELLGLVSNRLDVELTGARWQRRRVDRLEPELGRVEALREMLDEYMERSASGRPVHTWAEDA